MEKLHYEEKIHASKEKVWNTLWQYDNYRKWTSVFTEGSDVKTNNWQEGSKVLFLDNKGAGMVSRVAANKPNEFMSFEHLGEVHDGIEDTQSEKVKQWAGSHENYSLKEEDGTTTLVVEMDCTPEFKSYFEKVWPTAMQKIKQLAESVSSN